MTAEAKANASTAETDDGTRALPVRRAKLVHPCYHAPNMRALRPGGYRAVPEHVIGSRELVTPRTVHGAPPIDVPSSAADITAGTQSLSNSG